MLVLLACVCWLLNSGNMCYVEIRDSVKTLLFLMCIVDAKINFNFPRTLIIHISYTAANLHGPILWNEYLLSAQSLLQIRFFNMCTTICLRSLFELTAAHPPKHHPQHARPISKCLTVYGFVNYLFNVFELEIMELPASNHPKCRQLAMWATRRFSWPLKHSSR